MEQGLLYDFYGSLLTSHQQHIYEKAVYENLSLIEIAEEDGISRQAVHDLLRRCTSILQKYDSKLGLIARFQRLEADAEALEELGGRIRDPEVAEEAGKLAERIRRDLR